jgi:hypothetical protein
MLHGFVNQNLDLSTIVNEKAEKNIVKLGEELYAASN